MLCLLILLIIIRIIKYCKSATDVIVEIDMEYMASKFKHDNKLFTREYQLKCTGSTIIMLFLC